MAANTFCKINYWLKLAGIPLKGPVGACFAVARLVLGLLGAFFAQFVFWGRLKKRMLWLIKLVNSPG
jgi:hypothetical protein